MVDGQQLPSHQTGGWLIRDANRQVDVVVDQVDLTVLEQQLHIDFGVTPQKFRHMRMNHEPPHRFRHADAHQPLRFVGELAADFHHRPGRADHFLATLEHFLATVAQAQFTGGALQQTGGERLFQTRNAATDR
ncbi:hypothetical protein D3C86_1642870 [compost metagenome]